AILDLIPLAGATIAGIIIAIVAFLHSIPAGIVVVAFFIVYQQIENHLLQPVVYGRTVQLSPLAVLISVLIGAELAGVLGALAARPRPCGADGVPRGGCARGSQRIPQGERPSGAPTLGGALPGRAPALDGDGRAWLLLPQLGERLDLRQADRSLLSDGLPPFLVRRREPSLVVAGRRRDGRDQHVDQQPRAQGEHAEPQMERGRPRGGAFGRGTRDVLGSPGHDRDDRLRRPSLGKPRDTLSRAR